MAEDQIGQIVQQYFPPELQQQLLQYRELFPVVQEIRCRIDRPVILRLQRGQEVVAAECLTAAQLQHLVSRISQGSAFAWDEEYRRGYLTFPCVQGVGLAGKGVLEHGQNRACRL